MKKNLFLAVFVVFAAVFALISCEKDSELVEPNEEILESKSVLVNLDPDRYFDPKYIGELEKISGTPISKVSESKEFEGFYTSMSAANECFFERLLELTPAELTQVNESLESAQAYIDAGQEELGMAKLSDLYDYLGCTTDHPVVINGSVYNIPMVEIELAFDNANKAEGAVN